MGNADFTTQLLYVAAKTGVTVNLADMGINVLVDLIDYSAKIDSQVLGKTTTKTPPMNLSQMTNMGKMRG